MSLRLKDAAKLAGRVVYLEVVVLCLSIFSVLALLAKLLLPLTAAELALLWHIDTFICAIFLLDFFVHLWRAPSKRAYLKWGWIDLVSSIPEIQWLRWGRIFPIIRIVRALRSFTEVRDHLSLDRANGTFGVVTLISAFATIFATLAVLALETTPDANIRTPGDALWWAFCTITTIGYGDHYPVTTAGRVVAVILVVSGLRVFGTFTAYIASFFVGRGQHREETEIQHLTAEIGKLREKIELLDSAQRNSTPLASTRLTKQVPPSSAP